MLVSITARMYKVKKSHQIQQLKINVYMWTAFINYRSCNSRKTVRIITSREGVNLIH